MSKSADFKILRVPVELIRPLRHAVLRAGLPAEAAVFDADDEPTSIHLAALDSGDRVIGCLSIVRDDWEGEAAWRLRGMAVDSAAQRSGIGRTLVQEIESIIATDGHSSLLWCNARTPAVGFYQKMGWQAVGDEFDIPTAGPHFRMCKRLRTHR
jgi:GNAT superfamily N-acetyltransferase